MGILAPPLRIGTLEPVLLTDPVLRWGPVSVLAARPPRTPRIVVEDLRGITPASFRRTAEPWC
ncbi:MAG: hypothetical protein H0X17_04200 [Deltaproteobacteria bacterium]|nr:hypothetical protein [Deltaproteobacteria bacterium]